MNVSTPGLQTLTGTIGNLTSVIFQALSTAMQDQGENATAVDGVLASMAQSFVHRIYFKLYSLGKGMLNV